jgi:selenocysteine lyase/cysteine desulfurase
MSISRRAFLASTAVGVSAVASSCTGPQAERSSVAAATSTLPAASRWDQIRSEFDLSDEHVHMSALLIASHPRRVREAVERYRRELDRNPVGYLVEHNEELQQIAREAAARYLGGSADDVALTDSTTMGLGLLYAGLRLEPGQEVLTTANDYFVTHEALRAASERSGASVREIDLYEHGERVSGDELVDRILGAVTPKTRAVALTWVHSSTGLKIPLAEIARGLSTMNKGRDEDARTLLCVDGVHGFGVENVTMNAIGADFFSAGCHKWLFGPRGTGILWGRGDAWAAVRPTIPSFTDDVVWLAWLENRHPRGASTAARVTPGGFKAFEHQWALPEAFALHERIGRESVAARTHALARQLKEGLSRMSHVRLITPMDESLSSGIVCFDVAGMRPQTVVRRLGDRRIVATVTPYATMHVRLTPSILNTEKEIDVALEGVRALA